MENIIEIKAKHAVGDKVFTYADPIHLSDMTHLPVFEAKVESIKINNVTITEKGVDARILYGLELLNDDILEHRSNWDSTTTFESQIFKTLDEALKHAEIAVKEHIDRRLSTIEKLRESQRKLSLAAEKAKKKSKA